MRLPEGETEMNCPNCSTENPAVARFCGRCGRTFGQVTQPMVPAQPYVPARYPAFPVQQNIYLRRRRKGVGVVAIGLFFGFIGLVLLALYFLPSDLWLVERNTRLAILAIGIIFLALGFPVAIYGFLAWERTPNPGTSVPSVQFIQSPAVPASPSPPSRICLGCGYQLTQTTPYCPMCGKKL